MKAIIAASLLVAASSVQACERYDVLVSPFTYNQADVPFRKLVEMTEGRATFGLTRRKLDAALVGCTLQMNFTFTVHVAQELQRDECAYKRILDHELRHVELYRQAVAGAAARLAKTVPEMGINKAIEVEMESTLVPHREIDSPQEYRDNEVACDGAIVRLTMGRRFR